MSSLWIGTPSTRTCASGEIRSPVATTLPSIVTLPASVYRSASLREQTPALLKYLLILISCGCSAFLFLSIVSLYSLCAGYARSSLRV